MNSYAMSVIAPSLIFGTTVTLLSHHWVLAWIGLEINTLAIIPLMTKTPHPRAIEAATKYFLTQAAASALILFTSTFNAWITGQWDIATQNHDLSILLTVAISMKLGAAPFHFWLPEVLQGISIQTGLILSTWQKLAPMALLIQLTPSINHNLVMSIGLLSVAIGGWNGINQTQIRKIMAYSSIAQMGWVMIIIKFSTSLALLNFYLYIILTLILFSTFSYLNTKTIFNLNLYASKNPMLVTTTLLTLLSLGGLPPLTGFIPKWFIAQEMVKQNLTLFTLIALILTLLSLFFYLRLTYVMILTMAPSSSFTTLPWVTPKKNLLATPIIISLLLMPIAPTILAMT